MKGDETTISIRYTTESYYKRVYNETNKEYIVFGEYKGVHNYMSYYHTVCGQVTKIRPVEFFNAKHSTRCHYCLTKRQSKNTEWFLDKIKELTGDEYNLLSRYVASKKKVKMQHVLCGYTWLVSPDNFIRRSSRCPKCEGNAHLKPDEFLDKVKNELGFSYILKSTYTSMDNLISAKHLTCGYEFKVKAKNLLSSGCPLCCRSKGEKLVNDILINHSILFESQKTFPTCVHIHKLLFDFYLPKYNLLIEYDGGQHYFPVDFMGRGTEYAEERFKEGKIRDNIKTEWAHDNNIRLLRIPYTLKSNEVEKLILDTL